MLLPSKLFPALNLSPCKLKIIKKLDEFQVLDEIRKTWLVLTPEEWVRQHILFFLQSELKIPKGLIKIEAGLKLNSLQKRADIICYNHKGNPIILVECKSPNVPIQQNVFDQISRYNMVLNVPYLMVSNGLEHHYFIVDTLQQSYTFIPQLPKFQEIL